MVEEQLWAEMFNMEPYITLAKMFYPLVPAILLGWYSAYYMLKINSLAKKSNPNFLLRKHLADPIKSIGLQFKFLLYGLTFQLFRKPIREEMARLMYNMGDIKKSKDPRLVKMVEKLVLLNLFTFMLFVIGSIWYFINFLLLP